MPLSFELPKYARIVNAIQERISDGTYPAGSPVPSEARVGVEFKASRPTVVRAMGMLQQDGWIESEQGRGRFVRHPRGRALRQKSAGWDVLREDGAATTAVLDVKVREAPAGVAAALGLSAGSPVLARRRLVTAGIGPVELGTTYISVSVASGTGLAEARSLGPGGVLAHLSAHKRILFDHATQRIGARAATADEARLLDIAKREAVLTVFVVAFDATGQARLVTDAVIPPSRHELEERFPIG